MGTSLLLITSVSTWSMLLRQGKTKVWSTARLEQCMLRYENKVYLTSGNVWAMNQLLGFWSSA